MALIECKNCGSIISDAELSCPHCGYRLIEEKLEDYRDLLEQEELDSTYRAACPYFPDNLCIGQEIINFKLDSKLEGTPISSYGGLRDHRSIGFNNKPIRIFLHTHGISIHQGAFKHYYITNKQIIFIEHLSTTKFYNSYKKSVVQGAIGGAIAGPAGAILGVMLSDTERSKDLPLLRIRFWDAKKRLPIEIDVECSSDRYVVGKFISRREKEIARNIAENRQPDEEIYAWTGNLKIVLILATIIWGIYYITSH